MVNKIKVLFLSSIHDNIMFTVEGKHFLFMMEGRRIYHAPGEGCEVLV